MEAAGYPVADQMAALLACTAPSALAGVELRAHLAECARTLNQAQEKWGKRVLGITGPVPRAILLQQLGWRRLSAV